MSWTNTSFIFRWRVTSVTCDNPVLYGSSGDWEDYKPCDEPDVSINANRKQPEQHRMERSWGEIRAGEKEREVSISAWGGENIVEKYQQEDRIDCYLHKTDFVQSGDFWLRSNVLWKFWRMLSISTTA